MNKKKKCLSEQPTIGVNAIVENCTLGKYTEVVDGSKIVESTLGDYSYVRERCDIVHTHIGKFTNIASDVRINPGNHPMDWVSQHHFLYRMSQYGFGDSDNSAFFHWRSIQKVTIGHDTWIGHKAIILPGVSVGNGAVIAAGAVVNKAVPPYTVVGGVPAKKISSRFQEAIWHQLERIKWWNWDHETISERIEEFYNIRTFIERYGVRQ